MPTEIELKLSVDPKAASAPLRHPAVRALRAGRTRTARVDSSYYDTADSLLAGADVALRVRRDRQALGADDQGSGRIRRGRRTLRAQPSSNGRCRARCSTTALLATTPWSKLIAKARKRGGLARRFTTDFERRTIPLGFPDGIERGALHRSRRDSRGARRRDAARCRSRRSRSSSNRAPRRTCSASRSGSPTDLPVAVMTSEQGRARLCAAARRARRHRRAGRARTAFALAEDATDRGGARGARARMPAADRRQRAGTARRRRCRMGPPDADRHAAPALVPAPRRAVRAFRRARAPVADDVSGSRAFSARRATGTSSSARRCRRSPRGSSAIARPRRD